MGLEKRVLDLAPLWRHGRMGKCAGLLMHCPFCPPQAHCLLGAEWDETDPAPGEFWATWDGLTFNDAFTTNCERTVEIKDGRVLEVEVDPA